jgi:hypothetical protein
LTNLSYFVRLMMEKQKREAPFKEAWRNVPDLSTAGVTDSDFLL